MMEEMAELSYQMDEDEEDQQRDSGSEEEGRERNRDDPGGKRRRIEKRGESHGSCIENLISSKCTAMEEGYRQTGHGRGLGSLVFSQSHL